jgi:hypothetical protein
VIKMDEQNNTQTEKKSQTGSILAIVGIIVIVVAGIIGYQSMHKPQSADATNVAAQPTTAQTVQATTEPTVSQKSAYKDGKYSAVGDYVSPGGAEQLGVTLTIANGIVTDSDVTVKATRPESKERQTDFAEHYKTEVVGKSLADLQLGKVSGSSLSPKGFNDAVDKIKAEAKS